MAVTPVLISTPTVEKPQTYSYSAADGSVTLTVNGDPAVTGDDGYYVSIAGYRGQAEPVFVPLASMTVSGAVGENLNVTIHGMAQFNSGDVTNWASIVSGTPDNVANSNETINLVGNSQLYQSDDGMMFGSLTINGGEMNDSIFWLEGVQATLNTNLVGAEIAVLPTWVTEAGYDDVVNSVVRVNGAVTSNSTFFLGGITGPATSGVNTPEILVSNPSTFHATVDFGTSLLGTINPGGSTGDQGLLGLLGLTGAADYKLTPADVSGFSTLTIYAHGRALDALTVGGDLTGLTVSVNKTGTFISAAGDDIYAPGGVGTILHALS